MIIVGGGSAGAVLAARISENPRQSVLLLEAGPDYPSIDSLPQDLRHGNSSGPASIGPHTWSFSASATDHQPLMPLPRGKVMGGSSSINGTMFIRGLPEDFDNWAQLGNAEWTFPKLLPYFCRSEKDLDFGGDIHGFEGPIPISRYKLHKMEVVQQAFFEASLIEGFKEQLDMNHPDFAGIGPLPLNNSNGLRINTAMAYLNPVRNRSNLTIRPKSLVRRVLFDGNRAIGVEVEHRNRSARFDGEEIILCAGAICSPQILMLSGVGSAEQLRSLEIPLVHQLPGVGKNLRDHPMVLLMFKPRDGLVNQMAPVVQTAIRYTANGSDTRNDLMILPISYASNRGTALRREQNMFEGTSIGVALENPSTAGEITLKSKDPLIQPVVRFDYLKDKWDRDRLRQGILKAIKISEHQAYQNVVDSRISPTNEDLVSDATLDNWIMNAVTTQHHACGTSKMGPASDPMAVVDQFSRVHGLDGIRVVDASIMPDIVRANINASTIMIAERVASWL